MKVFSFLLREREVKKKKNEGTENQGRETKEEEKLNGILVSNKQNFFL